MQENKYQDFDNFQAARKDKRYVPRYDYDDRPEKPKLRLTYEHIAHLHNKDFERAICRDDFVEKYSPYYNILQFLHVFREGQGLSAYDPLPEEKLNIYIADKTPFADWREFLVAAYEHQATSDEIEALLDRDYDAA
jgi:fido (protein-threonine AMPylation protein)